jgi:arabinogalactan oligomer/maltooligosaccharide transport system permease protein
MIFRSRTSGKRLRRFELEELWISRLIIWFFMALVYIPILSIVSASLQTGDVFYSQTLLPDPRLFTFDNYRVLLMETRFPIWIKNTFLLGFAVATLQVAITVTSSYAFSRMRFFGRRYGIRTLFILQMMPSFVTLAAIQFVLFKLKMANLFGLLLVLAGASAWTIWLLKGYMDGIPRELDEAAKVDGCTEWQVFIKIILPLSRPMLAVLFLFSFMGIFSEFVLASAILKNPNDWLLTQGLKSFTNSYSTNWGRFSATVVLSSVPLAVTWMFAQKYVEAGLARGAVKG